MLTIHPVCMQMVGLKKIDLKVDMCCMKCAEIVSEEIREVPGEFTRFVSDYHEII
jgi:copper chaperone CopZ